jgi:hypothetical protein
MKKNVLLLGILVAALNLTACGGGGGEGGDSGKSHTVTFDSNGGSEVASQTVAHKGLVKKPADPTKSDPVRGDYVFLDWRNGEELWDFEHDKVLKDITLKARWLDRYEIKFVGADDVAISTTYVNSGTVLKDKPADPAAPAGKKFYGWMNTKNGGQIWDFDAEDLNLVLEDLELKPCFIDASLNPQAFEAELCPAITEDRGGQGMDGATYSGGAQGQQLINRALDGEYKASGAFFQEDDGSVRYATDADDKQLVFGGYVHFMYAKGDTLTWELESDAAAENVTMFARLGAEYAKPDPLTGEKKYTFTDEEFLIKVNGEAIKYGKITMHNVPDVGGFLTFQDFFMAANLSLKAGTNTIEMVVNNDINLFSTIAAVAPCVDCVKLVSTSNITWPKAKLANFERD